MLRLTGRTVAARVDFLGKTYRFSGALNHFNQLSTTLFTDPRTGAIIGLQLGLRPNGANWTAGVRILKNNVPFQATCTIPE